MSRRRPFIPQRTPIFIGCEGESERGYVALLGRIAEQAGLAVHLDAVLLQPGGGDPRAIIDRGIQRLGERRRKRGSGYDAQFILLDDDRVGQAPRRDARLLAVAAAAGMRLVWQSTCHEALLLRHLENCATLRPQTTELAAAQLRQRWPDYRKPASAADLARRIDREALVRAAGVEPDLRVLLEAIGIMEAR